MTTTQYQQYIQSHIYALADSQYSDHSLQQQYIIGFLTAQLASAMTHDNHVALRFRNTVNHLAIGPAASD
jgi:hypothetical protein